LATDGRRDIIDDNLKRFHLDRGQDGLVSWQDGPVTDDGNDIAMIRTDDHSTSAERDSGKLVVVNAGDINMTIRVCLDDPHLGSNNAAICTSIDKTIIHGGTFGMNSATECVEL